MSQEDNSNIDINATTAIVCDNCGQDKFKPIFFLRKLSFILSPDGVEKIIPIDSLACIYCNHVNTNFLPLIKN
jgi:hypothetical protein